jgi:hypothetical protein
MTAFFCTIFIVIHSHIWTRKGYAGINDILELHEVDKFIAHVLAEASFVALFVICMLEPLVYKYMNFNVTLGTKAMFSMTFLGSGAYMFFGAAIKKRLAKDQEEKK